jgi:hypothetical protein
MLLEEFGGASVGALRRRLVVMLSADPREGVADAGIGVDRHLGILAEHRDDRLLRLGRAELVLLGDMKQERPCDPGRLVERLIDADAVIADIAIGLAARRHQEGELAAEAIADRAELAAAGLVLAQIGEGDLEIGDALALVETLIELEGALPLVLGLIGELDARRLAPEEVGAERDITLRGEAVGEIAHSLVDAEDFLDDENAGPRAGFRDREITGETAAIGGADRHLRHDVLPLGFSFRSSG